MKTKIFNQNIKKNIRTVGLNPKLSVINNMKYLPAFSKEWKNIIYSFNKNNMKNIAVNSVSINKIIKSYFNLFFKDRKFVGRTKFIYMKRRRKLLKRIYVSDANIKYTSNKAKITLYTINKEKKALKRKYHKLNSKITYNFFKKYTFLYNNYIKKIYSHLLKEYKISKKGLFVTDLISKKKYIAHTFQYLNTFLKLNRIILKKIWNKLMKNQSRKYFARLRKFSLLYSLNQFKFNKFRLLSKLTYLLNNIIGKKIQYNIINLKSITYHPDLFTNILALKIQKERINPSRRIKSLLHKTRLVTNNKIKERTRTPATDKLDNFRDSYRDLKVISHMDTSSYASSKNLSSLLENILGKMYNDQNLVTKYKNDGNHSKQIHNLIFNSIGYKNLGGIKLQVSGRLTKRYRADRAIQFLKWKGGLKNVDSSFKGLSTVSFRGNTNSNVSYSLTRSKRRIGSFAIKGWIAGK